MAESKYGSSKESLDYKKVQDKVRICNKPNAKESDFQSLESLLKNFQKSFDELNQEEKNKELDSNEFRTISQDINTLNNQKGIKVNNLKNSIENMEDQKGLSQDEKIDKIYENISELMTSLNGLAQQKVSKTEEQSIKINGLDASIGILKNSIEGIKTDIAKIPKEKATLNLNPIEKKISNLENSLKKIEQTHNSKSDKIVSRIDNIKFPEFPEPSKIPTDYLKEDDFKFELNNKFNELKDLKELAENLETVPAKVNSIEKEIKSLSEKMDNLPSLNSSKNITNIPKEEKAVIDLAKYMNDGVSQFENIAKEYVSKIQELEKFEKAKDNHKKELERVKKDATNEGKKEGQISLIKEISEKFPTSFDEIKSLCKEYIREEFKKDEEIEITNKNQNDKIPFIEGEISLGKYKIITPAILLDDKIIIKAKVEEIKEKENKDG